MGCAYLEQRGSKSHPSNWLAGVGGTLADADGAASAPRERKSMEVRLEWRRLRHVFLVAVLAIAMTVGFAGTAQAASGTMYSGQGGYPYTYGNGTGTIAHYVQGLGTVYKSGTASHNWSFTTGNHYWSITGGGLIFGNAACYA